MLLFFGCCWIAAVLHAVLGYPLAGTLPLSLYHLYALAATGGWLLGNIEVNRERRWERRGGNPLPTPLRRRLFFLSLLSPVGVLALIWSLGPKSLRLGFPMAPIYAAGMLVLFFLVPVSLKRVFKAR